MPQDCLAGAARRYKPDTLVTFIKWYSRIALALGLIFTVPYIVFEHESAVTSSGSTGMTFEAVAFFVALVISGCLLAQALVVTLKFAARVRTSSAPRREMRWHLAALALMTIGYVVPMNV